MNSPIHITDGSKYASFDGLVLEVMGVSGTSDSRRLTIANVEAIAVASTGAEWMLVVKSPKGGFSALISEQKKPEWETLVQEVRTARAAALTQE